MQKQDYKWLMTGATILLALASLPFTQSVSATKKNGWQNTNAGRVYYKNGKKVKSSYGMTPEISVLISGVISVLLY